VIGVRAASLTEQVEPVGMPVTVWLPPAATERLPVNPVPQL